MNRMGARSNSGEGGEDPESYAPLPNGDRADNRIKQVASARFGVTTQYLVRADELEIKIAQGSKPGEGGQLPGHKVTALIARLRHAVPGIPLISPPPHHDIYSIEDLAQLIHDLKQVNPRARVGVKLVAEAGVGRVAAGVAKAYADYVLISGHNGGTGAAPLSSIQHPGPPGGLGLAETQALLIENGLRHRIEVRTDGGLRTGRDVVIAALLGAETYGFGTAALVAIGCDMARQCHLNTCPTGIATQRPELRKKFAGRPEQVVAYFTWIAEDVRRILADLGHRTLAPGCIRLRFRGSAGQSFGAFALPGMRLELEGEANDYVGKGLTGGELVIRPFRESVHAGLADQQVLLGNTVLYGATGGKLFAAGRAGDRFAVRNSGAIAVIEGAGAHCCEYMTGGVVVVLGPVGRNFAAGMSNGVAYVLDEAETFTARCNGDMVAVRALEESDERLILGLVGEHVGATGSVRGRAILDSWERYRDLFRKVVPYTAPVAAEPAAEEEAAAV